MQNCSLRDFKFVARPRMTWGAPGSLEMVKAPSPAFPCSSLSLPWEQQSTSSTVGIGHVIAKWAQPIFPNRKREQLIAAPVTPPEFGRNPTITGKTEMGLELTEKALEEQLQKNEEALKKPGIRNAHQGSDVSYSSTSVSLHKFWTMSCISWQACTQSPGRKDSKSNQQTKPQYNLLL